MSSGEFANRKRLESRVWMPLMSKITNFVENMKKMAFKKVFMGLRLKSEKDLPLYLHLSSDDTELR